MKNKSISNYPARKFLYRINAAGFTLIELLVVVLIIGILSAIALPQYRVAVLRARYVQLIAMGDAIYAAEQVYYLANGRYTENMDELDIQIPGYDGTKFAYGKDYRCHINEGYSEVYCQLYDTAPELKYHIYFNSGIKGCWVGVSNGSYSSVLQRVCQSVTGKAAAEEAGENENARKVYTF